ncbi:PIG-L family deacetylase [Allomuricauda sp. d1]|uniref:PIG-L family deacetylase n=1 Tax=Allomuricauda sp. d1 TaxID=3136725 RepID=UPI0031DF8832
MHKFWAFLLLSAVISLPLNAQKPKNHTSAEIYHELQKLNFLGTALYVAAHPDDENTRLISYLENEVHARTIYLSLTRGDGGQNLIGPELRELLGVLRTQELLAARSVDGGEQRFTRANDFGYSKHPDETHRIWNKEMVLGDVVKTIRQLKPDVIINRFDHRSPGSTHGHHTSSAMLGVEAFDLASDSNAYSEQLNAMDTWQPKRLFFNTSWWFYGSRENFEKADKSNLLQLDVGVFYPELGVSNNEIASLASSQHLCQGFGRISTRGSQDEYVELIKGSLPEDKTNLFEGIDTSWSRIEGGAAIGEILYNVENNFDFKNPATHLPELVKAYNLLESVKDDHWKVLKSPHLKEIILGCAGLYLEASAENASTYPGATEKVNIEALNRAGQNITLESISITGTETKLDLGENLDKNQKQNHELQLKVSLDKAHTSPYWLKEEGSLGMYTVNDETLIGLPETPEAYTANFKLTIDGTTIDFQKPVIHRYSKPDKGELYEPFVVLPKVTASFEDDVMIFADGKPKQIPVALRAGKDNVSGSVGLNLPEGWKANETTKQFSIEKKGEVKTMLFEVVPPDNESEGFISPILTVEGEQYDKKLVEIDYSHIPKQSVLLPAKAKIVRLNIQKSGEHIGYIVGAGDKIPESLEQIGYQVHTIDVDNIQKGVLDKYDAIVVGIRAYNVVDQLKFKQPILMEYVKNGGNLIVQYNTANRWRSQFENIAPYSLTLSRDRVTDEQAPVEIIAKNHALVNFPNSITEKDFDGWVQERGLYFPNEWSEEFTPILSMNDKGEAQKKGSLLVAPYGEGNYIYTGLSFFRELPAGVSGAYKLFANMLSLGKEKIATENEVKG